MFNWLDFFIILFFISISLFIINSNNFITILLFAELSWIILYCLSILIGSYQDDLNSISFTFFILGFGGLEFVVGFILLLLMKNLNINLGNNNIKKTNVYNNKKFNL